MGAHLIAAAAPERLRTEQYVDASNLDARIALHRLFSVNPQGWTRWLFQQLESLSLPPSARVLELGCGPGILWTDNAERVPDGWDVRLSDFSAGMLEEAQARLSAAGVRCRTAFEEIDAASIPHEDACFDCVVANHMLYHVPDRPRALSEIRRVLRPGGQLFASTLSADSMAELGAIVRAATERESFKQMRAAGHFTLENGPSQLAPYFPKVAVRRYVDALEVTDSAPLLAYLESMILDEPLREEELAAVGRRVDAEIAGSGAFRISKDGGVLLAAAPA